MIYSILRLILGALLVFAGFVLFLIAGSWGAACTSLFGYCLSFPGFPTLWAAAGAIADSFGAMLFWSALFR